MQEPLTARIRDEWKDSFYEALGYRGKDDSKDQGSKRCQDKDDQGKDRLYENLSVFGLMKFLKCNLYESKSKTAYEILSRERRMKDDSNSGLMPNTLLFLKFLERISFADLMLMVCLVVVSSIFYSLPSIYEHRTHQYQYTWRLSAAFIEGKVNATLLLLFFIGGCIFLSFLVSRRTHVVVVYEVEASNIPQETRNPVGQENNRMRERERQSTKPQDFSEVVDSIKKEFEKKSVETVVTKSDDIAFFVFNHFKNASDFRDFVKHECKSVKETSVVRSSFLRDLKALELIPPYEVVFSPKICNSIKEELNEQLKRKTFAKPFDETSSTQPPPPRILFARYQQRNLNLYFDSKKNRDEAYEAKMLFSVLFSEGYEIEKMNDIFKLEEQKNKENGKWKVADVCDVFSPKILSRICCREEKKENGKCKVADVFDVCSPKILSCKCCREEKKENGKWKVADVCYVCSPKVLSRVCSRMLYFSVMITLMVCINVLYITAAVYYSGAQLVAVQLALGFFKLIYVNVILPYTLHWFDSWLALKGHIKTRFLCFMGIMCSVVVDCVSVIGNICFYFLGFDFSL